MPSVVVDLTRLKKLHCGLGQFALHLGGALAEYAPADLQATFLVPRSAAELIPTAGTPHRTTRSRWWQKEVIRRRLRSLQRLTPGFPRGHLWHTIDHLSSYGPIDDRTPVVLTIHDLNFPPQRTSAQIRESYRKLQARIDRATILTTGSHFAAAQIREQLDVGNKELRVIYHGLCVRPQSEAPRPAFAPDGPFLFSIGEFRPLKNFHVLVEFLQRLPRQLRLVIAGNRATPYGEEVAAQVQRAGLSERILMPGVVNDAERHWLYQHCAAFVFPSLGEGFGLPAIEAMSFGKPVFLAHATSLPEVGGPLAFYWHDGDPQTMCDVYEQGMALVAADATYSDRLRAHAARFTWPAAAREYLTLYQEVLLESARGRSRRSAAA